MKLLVINPVATDKWDRGDLEYVSRFASPQDVVDVVSLREGPSSIENAVTEAEAERGVVELVADLGARYDAIMVNCFAEPGVMAARELVDVPVVGPCQASILVASQLGERFCIVSPRGDHGSMASRRVRMLGFDSRLASCEGIGVAVLDLDREKEMTANAVVACAERGLDRGADVVILGCTGMACIIDDVRSRLSRPVVEPMAAGFAVARALAGLGATTSRQGLYLRASERELRGGGL